MSDEDGNVVMENGHVMQNPHGTLKLFFFQIILSDYIDMIYVAC